MQNFYDVLQVEYNGCPPDCSVCEAACVKERTGDEACAGVTAIHLPEIGFHTVMRCNQCSDPACLAICPTGAITKSKDDGIVRINEAICVGCGLCTLACPYGGVNNNFNTQKAFKCDFCDGEPKCIDACPLGLLSLLKSRNVMGYMRAEDAFSQGVPNCLGCPVELSLRFTLKVLGHDTFMFASQGCSIFLMRGASRHATSKVPTTICMMTNVASTMTGLKRYYRHLGQDVKCVAFVGDGATVDIGLQPLSGAAERGENLIYICCDNEGYQAPGNQRSGSTSFMGKTATTPVGKWQGKPQSPKYMPLIMASHSIPYVATATISHPEDYARKLIKAMAVKDGLSYIHLFSPCPTGWRARTEDTIDICRIAVETCYFPLWEAERGKFRFTYKVDKPKHIREFTKMMGRFSHLDEEGRGELQRLVNERFNLIESLIRMKGNEPHLDKRG
jgi:phenylglyoxylate dehydrogenase beta subunit